MNGREISHGEIKRNRRQISVGFVDCVKSMIYSIIPCVGFYYLLFGNVEFTTVISSATMAA